MLHLPYYGRKKNFPEKSERMILNHFSLPVIKYNFTKIQLENIKKKSKVLILGPKMTHFPH